MENRARVIERKDSKLTNLQVVDEQSDDESSEKNPDRQSNVPRLGHLLDKLLRDEVVLEGIVFVILVQRLDGGSRSGRGCCRLAVVIEVKVRVGFDGADDFIESESTGMGLKRVPGVQTEEEKSHSAWAKRKRGRERRGRTRRAP